MWQLARSIFSPAPSKLVNRIFFMSDTDKKIDQDKGDEVLKRLLKTPPRPKVKDSKTTDNKTEKSNDK